MRGLQLILIGCILGTLATTAGAGELLKDQDSASSWRKSLHGIAEMSVTDDQNAIRFDVTQIDDNPRNAVAFQVLTGIRSKVPYTLRFSAKASSARSFAVMFRQGEKPYRFVASPPPVQLTTDWKQFVIPIQFDAAADGKSILGPLFVLGNAMGTVWVKNPSLWDNSLGLAAAGATVDQPSPGQSSPSNFLRDPLDLRTWTFELRSGAKAAVSKSGDDLKVIVEKAGAQNADVMMYAVPMDLKTPGTYTLDLAMRSDAPRDIALLTTSTTPPYEELMSLTSISIDTQLRLYRATITLNKIPATGVRMPILQFGKSAGTIWVRPVSITKLAAPGK